MREFLNIISWSITIALFISFLRWFFDVDVEVDKVQRLFVVFIISLIGSLGGTRK